MRRRGVLGKGLQEVGEGKKRKNTDILFVNEA
jgi:hypothetical protein